MASKASMIVRCIGNLKKTPKYALICPFIGSAMFSNFYVGLFDYVENKESVPLERPSGKWGAFLISYVGVTVGFIVCAIKADILVFPLLSIFAGAITGSLAVDYPNGWIFSNLEKRLFKPKQVENSAFKNFYN